MRESFGGANNILAMISLVLAPCTDPAWAVYGDATKPKSSLAGRFPANPLDWWPSIS
jgi:hypothetical protein